MFMVEYNKKITSSISKYENLAINFNIYYKNKDNTVCNFIKNAK